MEDKSELQKLWDRMKLETMSGLRHGFFDFSLTGEVKNGKPGQRSPVQHPQNPAEPYLYRRV